MLEFAAYLYMAQYRQAMQSGTGLPLGFRRSWLMLI